MDVPPMVAQDINQVLQSLTKIRDRQEEALQEESVAKKQRVGANGGEDGAAATPAALMPFGGGGK